MTINRLVSKKEITSDEEVNELEFIAVFYDVGWDSGLTKSQVVMLMDYFPDNSEIYPIEIHYHAELDVRSIAHGFVKSEHFKYMEEISEVLSEVCNDWVSSSEYIYETKDGLKILLLRDFDTAE